MPDLSQPELVRQTRAGLIRKHRNLTPLRDHPICDDCVRQTLRDWLIHNEHYSQYFSEDAECDVTKHNERHTLWMVVDGLHDELERLRCSE